MDNRARLDLPIAFDKLAAFHPTDRIFLRDSRGLSSRPSLVRHPGNSSMLLACGDFLLHYDYRVPKDQGVRFVEVTGDENEIHRTADIVSGALTAAKVLVPLELLFPNLRIDSARLKFVGWSRYHRHTSTCFIFRRKDNNRWKIEIHGYQDQNPILAGTVEGEAEERPVLPDEVKGRKVNPKKVEAVREFFRSLNVDPNAYFKKGSFTDHTYPLAFVASLPSGEIVRQMHGQGGMLNILRFDFQGHKKIPLTGAAPPEVKLKRAKRRKSFNRILADIIDGVITYCRGIAIVHPKAEA